MDSQTMFSLVEKYGGSKKNTGDTRVQIAILTQKINHLTEHLKKNKKDFDTTNTLLKYVGKRRKLLRYLQRNNLESYRSLIKDLGLRH